MTEQQVYEDMKKFVKFMNGPNLDYGIYRTTYKPIYDKIIEIFRKNPTIYTPEKVREMNNRILRELNEENEIRKLNLKINMIVKKKLQILLNNYYAFRDKRLEVQLGNRNLQLLNQIQKIGDLNPKETLTKAMDEAIILILRDGIIKKLSTDPKIADRQTAYSKMINNYVQNTFYNANLSYFTEQKIQELINRSNNPLDIINVEGYKDEESMYMVGVM